jgi:hypothetical protein
LPPPPLPRAPPPLTPPGLPEDFFLAIGKPPAFRICCVTDP